MKQKFQNSDELHEFFLSELRNIVGVGGSVMFRTTIFDFLIIPDGGKKCLWQPTLRKLFEFFTEYDLRYYIDFKFGYLRVYTYEHIQKAIGTL